MKIGDILEFSAFDGGPNKKDILICWYALVVKIHSCKNDFYNVTLLWDNGELSRDHYHDLEFEVLNGEEAKN